MAQTVARRTPGIDQEVLNYLMMLQQRQSVPNSANEPRVGAGQYGLPYTPPLPQRGQTNPNELERAQAAFRTVYGPAVEAAVPYLPQKGREMAEEAKAQAPYALLGPAGRLISAYPKVAAGVAGLTAGAFPSQAGEKANPEVKRLQEQLRDAGYYTGPIDGLMKGKTQAAKEAFDKAEDKRLQMETERARIEAERLGKEATIKETVRQGKADETKKKQREEGEERLREMDKGESWASKTFREYAPLIGGAAGIVAGIGSRGWMARATNKAAREATKKADAYVAGGGNVRDRAGGVNTFWQEGGAQSIPFTAAPKAKHAVKSNRSAPSSTTLYPPRSQYNRPVDYATAAAFGGEAAITGVMVESTKAEMAEAQKALAADPSEANIQRFRAARNMVAGLEAASFAGRAAGLTHLGASTKLRYKNARPDVSKAESERLAIDHLINKRSRARTRTPK